MGQLSQIDKIVISIVDQTLLVNSGIFVFTSSDHDKRNIDPMPRDPNPSVGHFFDEEFASVFRDAISLNGAIHDGAVIFQKKRSEASFILTHWSCRLLPPKHSITKFPNKGSAFNSSLAASLLKDVLFVYCWSNEVIWKFENGQVLEINSAKIECL